MKRKISASLCLVGVVLLSSSKKESTEQLYSEQIRSISGIEEVTGGKIEADSLKGKMLILNFWASYDATSRINNYQLIELSEKYEGSKFYNGDGLDVISISLDKYKSPLLKAIETDGTDKFHHICDYKGVDSDLAKSFDVNRPVNLLIDAEGKIVARDFNVSNLNTTLEMLASNN